MRTFIAIDFDMELKKSIYAVQSCLRNNALEGRWKHIDNFHLTLKFLDEVEKPKAAEIAKRLDSLCSAMPCFKLKISGMGSFGSGRMPLKALWLGIGGDLERLHMLQRQIDMSLLDLGFETEKRSYKPHITIGQDIVLKTGLDIISKAIDISNMPAINADRIYLFKSEQINGKRVYTPLSEHRFESKKEGSVIEKEA